MKHVKIYILFISLIACNSVKNKQLEFALNFAGNNRIELEKVLKYYKDDPEKLAAAQFLIENMVVHYSFKSEKFDRIKKDIPSIIYGNETRIENTQKYIEQKYGKLSSGDFIVENDAQSVTADYLIRNIDLAFKVWREQPWGKHISFDLFCKEILPYRVNNEPLEDWREAYYNYFQPVLDSLLVDNCPYSACKILYEYICKQDWIFLEDLASPHLGAKTLLDGRFGYCRDYADFIAYTMRALGILNGADVILQNTDNISKRHYWSSVKDTLGRTIGFELYATPPGSTEFSRKRGKVYRQSFGIQPSSLIANYPKKKIPEELKSPFLLDVTHEYFGENQVEIHIPRKEQKDNLLYLSVFNNSTWIPVSWTEIKSGKATFKNLEPGVVFMPTFYVDGINEIAGHPFYIKENKEINRFIPDTMKHIEVIAKRKYSYRTLHEKMRTVSIGGKFQVSNNIHFTNCIDLFTITNEVEPHYYEFNTNSSEKFRYIRYLSSNKGYIGRNYLFFINDTSYCNLAELEVYTTDYTELKGTIIGTEGTTRNSPGNTKQAVFDKDPLTFFESDEPHNAWVGLDFGEPKQIEKIRYLSRNDDNNIREGDLYELFYFSKEQGLVSLGKQIGNREQKLVYSNVPDKALLWLHNHTRGKEERIFSYENGEQVWW